MLAVRFVECPQVAWRKHILPEMVRPFSNYRQVASTKKLQTPTGFWARQPYTRLPLATQRRQGVLTTALQPLSVNRGPFRFPNRINRKLHKSEQGCTPHNSKRRSCRAAPMRGPCKRTVVQFQPDVKADRSVFRDAGRWNNSVQSLTHYGLTEFVPGSPRLPANLHRLVVSCSSICKRSCWGSVAVSWGVDPLQMIGDESG